VADYSGLVGAQSGNNIFLNARKVDKMTHDEIVMWCDQNAEMIAEYVWGKGVIVDRKIWEKPIWFGGKCGFVDLSIECHGVIVQPDGARKIYGDDFLLAETKIINIEVKTRINSAGELIRQLRRYREATPFRTVVVSLDDRFKEILESQGFWFVLAGGGQMSLMP